MDSPEKARRSKLAARSILKIENYRKVFSSPEGQWVINDLMAAHGMLSSTFVGTQKVHEMLHKEGERNVVLRILKLIGTDPKDLRERIEDYEKSLAE